MKTPTQKTLFLISIPIALLFLASFVPGRQTDSGRGRAKIQARPALSGPVSNYDTEYFRIHYTLEGQDAVPSTDADGNNQPDYVETAAEALQFAWRQQIDRLGWQPPLPDRGEGGDTRFDVYLENQNLLSSSGDTFYGYVETYGGLVGDNPVTEIIETNAAYGYLSLDNDYRPDKLGEELPPLDSLRTTAAHELQHAIQAAYDDWDPYEWLYEASAVWIEDQVYPEIGDAKSYLADYMHAPDLCPLSVGRDDQDVRWYGGWILLRYISEHYGGPDTIRRLWEQMATLDGLEALEATLAEQQTSLAEVLVDFAIANLAQSDCPTNRPYCYANGRDYRRPYVEDSVRVRPGETKTLLPKDGVQQFGADYIRLKGKEPFRIDFQGSPAGRWQLRLVGLKNGQANVTPWTQSNSTPVTPADFDKLYLVVVNTAPVEMEENCGYHNYTLAFIAQSANREIEPPPVPSDPGPYVPPIFGANWKSSLFFPGQGEPIQAEEAPFLLLYPDYLPPGYVFDQILRYSPADLGQWAEDYAPSGQPVVTLKYRNPTADRQITLSQSPTPLETIFDWVKDRGYVENDIRLVNNKPVHLITFTDETGPNSAATFIHHNLFIVIEGRLDLIEIQQVVAGLLANNP